MSRRFAPATLATLLALVALLASSATGATAATAATRKHITIRASLIDVENALMCTSCHEPLRAVQSPEALQEKGVVQTLIAQGDTKQQILNAMVAQYGEDVLAKPPASGFDLLVYVVPPAIVVAGALFLIFALPRWRARAKAHESDADAASHRPLSQSDALRLNEELERLI